MSGRAHRRADGAAPGPLDSSRKDEGPTSRRDAEAVGELGIRLLLQGLHERWGLDFRHYAMSSVRRLGFLALGSKETVRFIPREDRYRGMPGPIWRKVA